MYIACMNTPRAVVLLYYMFQACKERNAAQCGITCISQCFVVWFVSSLLSLDKQANLTAGTLAVKMLYID